MLWNVPGRFEVSRSLGLGPLCSPYSLARDINATDNGSAEKQKKLAGSMIIQLLSLKETLFILGLNRFLQITVNK